MLGISTYTCQQFKINLGIRTYCTFTQDLLTFRPQCRNNTVVSAKVYKHHTQSKVVVVYILNYPIMQRYSSEPDTSLVEEHEDMHRASRLQVILIENWALLPASFHRSIFLTSKFKLGFKLAFLCWHIFFPIL